MAHTQPNQPEPYPPVNPAPAPAAAASAMHSPGHQQTAFPTQQIHLQQLQQLQQQQQQQAQPPPLPHRTASPALSLLEPMLVGPSNPIEQLFHNLNPGPPAPASHDGSYPYAAQNSYPAHSSAPATPMSAASVAASTASAPVVAQGDRQNALLSLLGSAASGPQQQQQQQLAQSQPAPQQQIPTPPHAGQAPPSTGTGTNAQALLEQIMGGPGRRGSGQQDSPAGSLHSLHALAPSPPYGMSPYQPIAPPSLPPAPQQHQQHQHQQHQYQQQQMYDEPALEQGSYYATPRDLPHIPGMSAPAQHPYPHPSPPPPPQPQQQEQQQPMQQQAAQSPSPPRTMFDFVSPFDALSSSGSQPGSVKRKPAPAAGSGAPHAHDSGSFNIQDFPAPPAPQQQQPGAPGDTKRRSTDLLEQLSRGNAAGASQAQLDAYYGAEELTPVAERVVALAQAPPPMSMQQATKGLTSPRASPPKVHAQVQQLRPQARQLESGLSDSSFGSAPGGGNAGGARRRNKESSPGPRGSGWKDGGKRKGKGPSPSSDKPSTVTFDVAQPLDEIMAPRDCVKSTAIALVKVESAFLPGTTIGATQWVAYSMTKGRVRVISRSSGDRTLLRLPNSCFPESVMITDMAVYGRRLAGVTSNGGFVVWELPEVITDDAPGRIVLLVVPSANCEPLQSVKWHPKQMDMVAVASASQINLIHIVDAMQLFDGNPITQDQLEAAGPVFRMPEGQPLVAFDFDVHHFAIGTVAADSTLTLWSIRDKLPFWQNKIRGDDAPSSVAFIQDGVIIGRRNGTVFQLLPVMSRNVSTTIKFTNGAGEDADMFGRANYDARIRTLWIANNRRDSMVAFRIGFEQDASGEDEYSRPYVEQVLEFVGPKPTIHFVILTADADPLGEEAMAACSAAKVPVGDLALVAFSVHSSGVDQILIRKEWFETGLSTATAKFPLPPVQAPAQQQQQQPGTYQYSQVEPAASSSSSRSRQPTAQSSQGGAPAPKPVELAPPQPAQAQAAPRARTPPSEEVEAETAVREEGRSEGRAARSKGKNVNFREKERERAKDAADDSSGREKAPAAAAAAKQEPAPVPADTPLGGHLSKEIRKLEENLQNRIGRLISKELDKQNHRLDEARSVEKQDGVARQEHLLKIVSTELTRNTTRVVELAVKNEVQASVLPGLQGTMSMELKSALHGQLTQGIADAVKQTLPNEMERVLKRPDVANLLARSFSGAIAPVVEQQVNSAMTQMVLPTWKQQATSLHQEIVRELRSEVHGLKNELSNWQNEQLRHQEALIRDLDQTVRKLSDQVKQLSLSPPIPAVNPNTATTMNNQPRSSPSHTASNQQQPPSMPHYSMRQQPIPPVQQPASFAQPQYQSPQQQSQNPPQQVQGQWYSSPNIAAPQASHPAFPPPVPAPAQQLVSVQQNSASRTEEWDDQYLAALSQPNNSSPLYELLSRSDPEIVMPLNAPPQVSQAVILTLIHRLSQSLGDISPMDDNFMLTIWWLTRAASVLDSADPLVSSFIPRLLPQAQGLLNTIRQRISILPGASPGLMESARAISDVQTILSRKPVAL